MAAVGAMSFTTVHTCLQPFGPMVHRLLASDGRGPWPALLGAREAGLAAGERLVSLLERVIVP